MRALSLLLFLATMASPYALQARSGPKCIEIGQWYNAEDSKRLPWIGFRLANVRSAAHLSLVLRGEGGSRRFALPLTTRANKGPYWVRMNLEKNGWDFVVVQTPLHSRSGRCQWVLQAPGGKTLLSGEVTLQAKRETAFAPPNPRLANQHNHPGKPRPVGKRR